MMIEHAGDDVAGPSLVEQVRLLNARQDILDCVHRYACAIDRNDDDLLRSAFFDDAVTSHAYHRGGIAGFVTWVRERMESYSATSHCITNHRSEVSGATAHSESYGTVFTKGTDASTLSIRGIRYIDHLQYRDGIWKIAARQFVMDWYSPVVSESNGQPFIDNGAYVLGTQDRTDPSYMRPLKPRLDPVSAADSPAG